MASKLGGKGDPNKRKHTSRSDINPIAPQGSSAVPEEQVQLSDNISSLQTILNTSNVLSSMSDSLYKTQVLESKIQQENTMHQIKMDQIDEEQALALYEKKEKLKFDSKVASELRNYDKELVELRQQILADENPSKVERFNEQAAQLRENRLVENEWMNDYQKEYMSANLDNVSFEHESSLHLEDIKLTMEQVEQTALLESENTVNQIRYGLMTGEEGWANLQGILSRYNQSDSITSTQAIELKNKQYGMLVLADIQSILDSRKEDREKIAEAKLEEYATNPLQGAALDPILREKVSNLIARSKSSKLKGLSHTDMKRLYPSFIDPKGTPFERYEMLQEGYRRAREAGAKPEALNKIQLDISRATGETLADVTFDSKWDEVRQADNTGGEVKLGGRTYSGASLSNLRYGMDKRKKELAEMTEQERMEARAKGRFYGAWSDVRSAVKTEEFTNNGIYDPKTNKHQQAFTESLFKLKQEGALSKTTVEQLFARPMNLFAEDRDLEALNTIKVITKASEATGTSDDIITALGHSDVAPLQAMASLQLPGLKDDPKLEAAILYTTNTSYKDYESAIKENEELSDDRIDGYISDALIKKLKVKNPKKALNKLSKSEQKILRSAIWALGNYNKKSNSKRPYRDAADYLIQKRADALIIYDDNNIVPAEKTTRETLRESINSAAKFKHGAAFMGREINPDPTEDNWKSKYKRFYGVEDLIKKQEKFLDSRIALNDLTVLSNSKGTYIGIEKDGIGEIVKLEENTDIPHFIGVTHEEANDAPEGVAQKQWVKALWEREQYRLHYYLASKDESLSEEEQRNAFHKYVTVTSPKFTDELRRDVSEGSSLDFLHEPILGTSKPSPLVAHVIHALGNEGNMTLEELPRDIQGNPMVDIVETNEGHVIIPKAGDDYKEEFEETGRFLAGGFESRKEAMNYLKVTTNLQGSISDYVDEYIASKDTIIPRLDKAPTTSLPEPPEEADTFDKFIHYTDGWGEVYKDVHEDLDEILRYTLPESSSQEKVKETAVSLARNINIFDGNLKLGLAAHFSSPEEVREAGDEVPSKVKKKVEDILLRYFPERKDIPLPNIIQEDIRRGKI